MRIQNFRDVIGLWDSVPQLAGKLGEKPFTVEKWRTRNRIPDRAYKRLIEVARKDKKPITAELLVSLAANPRDQRRSMP